MITKTVWISENFKDELIDGLELLLTEHQHILVKDRVTAEIQLECKHICDNKLIIKKRENCCVIYYSQKAHFFRGVSLLLIKQKNNLLSRKQLILSQTEL